MNKHSILYIDDEYMNLLAFEAQFRRDYQVYCVGKESEAFKCLETKPIRFFFSDQRMPKILGTELLAKVKERFPDVHRCIISGYTEDVAIKDALRNGVAEVTFEKPYRAREIEEYIKKKVNGKDTKL